MKIEVLWKWEAPPGGAGDIYEAVFRGTNARIELRQGAAEKFVPEVYVVPGANTAAAAIWARTSRCRPRDRQVADAVAGDLGFSEQ